MKQSVVEFIRKSWHDNRGLQRQFILGLRTHISETKKVSKETKQSFNKIKKQLTNYAESSASEGELKCDTKEPFIIVESWDKEKNSQGKGKFEKRVHFKNRQR